MRSIRPLLLVLAIAGALQATAHAATVAPASAAPAPAPVPAIGCASLANLRLLLRESKDVVATVVVRLNDDKADHLGCQIIPRDAVAGIAEHLTLNGSAYDCLTLRSTSVCQWVVAGTVKPAGATAKPRTGEKTKASDKASSSDKTSSSEKSAPSDRSPAPEKSRR
ncbi:hypothetical protein ASF58_07990 [Methylobacterium sp. Leaf125]|uniref:hypothetical protein n=1 Tax=Methylobacterium sp. Leaf125 TaxID=1736265 RepID=UPI0006FEAB6A|nr:hypothetical protein [Methylobacterium sp. Leaf125]KQQ40890.1 hypothetical protein ASF58_07990 [Methylobacterium sp. Leaf125]